MAVIDEPLQTMIDRLRRQHTDDGDIEAKACGHGLSASVWESVSAFANTAGGVLLLGVDEESGFKPAVGFSLNKVRDQFIEGIGDGGVNGARLTHPPVYELSRETLENQQILKILIHENTIDQKPCYVTAKGVGSGSYKRVDDKDIRLSGAEIYELQNALRPSDADMQIVREANVADLSKRGIQRILDARKSSKALRGANTRQEQLARLNITDKKGGIRLAGLLVAGEYPQQFFPRLIIDVAVHPGTGKSQDDKVRFIDRERCEGPLPEMIDEAVEAVARNLRKTSVVEGVARREELEIPREALREVIANAVVHREYHSMFVGAPVSVDVFYDRLEVTNPGGLWGGKTLANLDDGQSKCRNTALIQLMQDVPLSREDGTTVEGQGTGIPLVKREAKKSKGLKLEFKASADWFKVIFWRQDIVIRHMATHRRMSHVPTHRLSKSATQRLSVDDVQGQISEEDLEDYFNRFPIDSESDSEPHDTSVSSAVKRQIRNDSQLLTLIPENDVISARELANQTGKSVETVRRELRRLIQEQKVEPIGKSKSRQRVYRRL
ncbi:putative DNA binding domain-containing protein [Bifidobacterium sp. ESL0769]|uniref:ATP-binding protein n=1 Tax=Bifidobacterium sp. ESL0769 TaxID=2983229 RepID=UPI0023F7975D|nr:ATP-binding protein [Bifidobacterium sp. ESL0769]WEV67515.1 putative DNA binding domain-containing protein [Bifidobacterium sp. ESL0769]